MSSTQIQVQSELGDYDPIEHGPTIDYLRDFDFAPSQSDDLLEKIMEIHRTTLKGQSPAEAGQYFNLFLLEPLELATWPLHLCSRCNPSEVLYPPRMILEHPPNL